MVSIHDNFKCAIAITNMAPFDIYLQRGAIVRLIECEDKSDPISLLSSHNIKDIINSIAPVKLSSESLSKSDIEKRANLNVPTQFKSRSVDILFKHRAAISIGKHNLGRANHSHHKIHLKDTSLVYRKQFKIPDSNHDFLTKEIAEWLKLGVMRRSSSMYNSPIFCVPKKNGAGLRIVQDFRELNQHSHIDKYSMKEIIECIGDIGHAGSTIFSTLDLTSGFWQMPMHPKDSHLTAFAILGKEQF